MIYCAYNAFTNTVLNFSSECIGKYNFFHLSSNFDDFFYINIAIVPNLGIKNYLLF